ncbi:diguanylate cyclase [Pseudodesulfovibrio sp.]|uniref:sensor domain-containing diguanylate cyclase n=1 Tax=Pseudodesulfovibrio sp. TaxID=2035812 RepID=UPI00262B112A|nr:diguanylate cyclase [Pseudodesulfovibrio sp.]MDD3313080.1 diguanylate cyclase [Pseudodesulfovibrio sp.]
MPISTGKFDALGVSYEDGTNAKLLAAIARGAEDLTSGRGWPDAVNGLLEALGRVTGVSRVWIFQTIRLTDTHITQNYTFEWAAAPRYRQIGMPMFSMFTKVIDSPEYRDLIESRRRGEWQKTLTRLLDPGWFRDDQDVQKIKSMLTIPVMVEDEWWGTLGFDDCEREYDWSDVEIALLRVAGYLISNAVLHDRLSARRKQFDILRRITGSGVWAYDFRTGQVWCSAELIHSVPMPTDNFSLSLRGALQWVHPGDRRGLLAAARDHLVSGRDVFRFDARLFSDCGDIRWVELIGNVRLGASGNPEQFAGIAVDIRARKREEERLRKEAVSDPLTGVMNRRMFLRTLREHIDLGIDQETGFALLLLDIDWFKGVNDRYGHVAGDEVLRHFVRTCDAALNHQGVLARLGGDEFAVLLPGAGLEEARSAGELLRRAVLNSPCRFEDRRILLTASVGVTAHPPGVATPARIIESADLALYEAKRAGRNCLMAAPEGACLATPPPGGE